MQGKTKSFLEDTVILIVVVVLAFGSYKLYEYFSQDNQSEIKKEEIKTEEKTALEIQEEQEDIDILTNKSDTNTTTDSFYSVNKSNQNIEKKTITATPTKKIEKITTTQKVENKKEKEVQKLIKAEQKEKVKPKVISQTVQTLEVKSNIKSIEKAVNSTLDTQTKKDVDLELLRKFLRDLKFNIASHIVKRDDIEDGTSQKLKIRVTILPDGNYEKLIFVSGDKELFEQNKQNITSIFPVKVDNKIKADFPRYVRLTIK